MSMSMEMLKTNCSYRIRNCYNFLKVGPQPNSNFSPTFTKLFQKLAGLGLKMGHEPVEHLLLHFIGHIHFVFDRSRYFAKKYFFVPE